MRDYRIGTDYIASCTSYIGDTSMEAPPPPTTDGFIRAPIPESIVLAVRTLIYSNPLEMDSFFFLFLVSRRFMSLQCDVSVDENEANEISYKYECM